MEKTSDKGWSVFDVPPQTAQSDQTKYDKAYKATGAKTRKSDPMSGPSKWGISKRDSAAMDDKYIKNYDFPPAPREYKVADKEGNVRRFNDGGARGMKVKREFADKYMPAITGYERTGQTPPADLIPRTPKNSTKWGSLEDSLAMDNKIKDQNSLESFREHERRKKDREFEAAERKRK